MDTQDPLNYSRPAAIVKRRHLRWLLLNLGGNALALGACCLVSFGLIALFRAQTGVVYLSETSRSVFYQMVAETIPVTIGCLITFVCVIAFSVKIWKGAIPIALRPLMC